MLFENPFEAPGEWLKGNLHTHTTVSDGRQTPQERVEAYEAKGYDFLALTDHDVLAETESLSPKHLTLIRGIEVGCDNPVGGPPYHVVGLHLPKRFRMPSSRHVQTVVDAFNDAGGKAIIAHPYWCGQNVRDLSVVSDYLGLEVFNTTCLRTIGKGTSSVHWDDVLALRKRVFGFAVDDTHDEARDAFQGWIMVKCRRRTADPLMEAISLGRFYATCGPTFEAVSVRDNRVRVKTSPATHISFICDGPRGAHVCHQDGSPVTEAEFALSGAGIYVRIECADQAGRSAWTNPIFVR